MVTVHTIYVWLQKFFGLGAPNPSRAGPVGRTRTVSRPVHRENQGTYGDSRNAVARKDCRGLWVPHALMLSSMSWCSGLLTTAEGTGQLHSHV